MTRKHYVYGSGSYGCLYDYGPCAATTRKAAAEDLAAVFELSGRATKRLARDGYLDLPRGAGADYCEITECDCSNPEQHED